MSENKSAMTTEPIMQTYNRFPITITKGKGSYVWDDKGEKYLDYSSGIATCNLGHVPDVVKQSVEEQLQNLWHCSNLYHIPQQQSLAQLLVDHSFGDQVFFCNSGAEANEAAIKLARKYASNQNKKEAFEVVTFTNSFHGRTLATLSATGQEKIQHGFDPLMPGFRYLPFNDHEALDQLVQSNTCAVLLELVQGEGGVIPADQEWVNKIVEICKQHNLVLMVDEIQTGMGRTGSLFAYEQYGIEPDVMTLAKGLGSGFPIGAVVAKEHVAKAFGPGTHGSTFGGNPVVTTAGYATLNHMVTSDILPKANELSSYIVEKLQQFVDRNDDLLSIRGKGLLIGIEVKGKAIEYVEKARENHVLILVAGPNVVRILPPLTTTKQEIDHFIEKMEKVFN
ncbi:acetylornithine transaminase [Aquibacillus sediminis]|uniref:acetylornithine transaminase n=1 Tax=Aquibacillus sediminis TaxID=2574734 RepID=UPI001109D410|nr:acetylornithine transaminase [Aquibacillus sediminis]